MKVKQEHGEAFSVEEIVPVWAKKLRDDFLRNKVDDLVVTDSETGDEETYYYSLILSNYQYLLLNLIEVGAPSWFLIPRTEIRISYMNM